MDIQELNQAVTNLSDRDFRLHLHHVLGERRVRSARPVVEQRENQIASDWHHDNPGEVNDNGVPVWVRPTGAHDSYPAGMVVAHKGKEWRNTRATVNAWEPGEDPSWVDTAEEDAAPEDDAAEGDAAEEDAAPEDGIIDAPDEAGGKSEG